MTPKRRWGWCSNRCSFRDCCPSTSVICDAQQWRQWLACPFLGIFPHDLLGLPVRDYHPLFPVVWFLAVYRNSRHGRAMITCDAWRLTIKVRNVQRGYWPVALLIHSFCVTCMICQASSYSICFQRLRFASPGVRLRQTFLALENFPNIRVLL